MYRHPLNREMNDSTDPFYLRSYSSTTKKYFLDMLTTQEKYPVGIWAFWINAPARTFELNTLKLVTK